MSEIKQYRLPEGYILAGRYRIERVLGEGGFGITYKAFDTKLIQPVAVKEFYPHGYATRNTGSSASVSVSGPSAQSVYASWKEGSCGRRGSWRNAAGSPGSYRCGISLRGTTPRIS